jgi:hypothetical protein
MENHAGHTWQHSPSFLLRTVEQRDAKNVDVS